MLLILFVMSLGSMSHVDFKKSLCRSVEFRGQGPWYWEVGCEKITPCREGYLYGLTRKSEPGQGHLT